ncbi:unnamed protein product [Cylindrotheca closterium]|uniref:Protein kinase domain-containing protein n=1 Tax=Cylindrotheca closterium TaxID=2856 RepID=A0AAD2FJM4_9STRA|nr:unnamed protein product [Cylindrotheca closterium]
MVGRSLFKHYEKGPRNRRSRVDGVEVMQERIVKYLDEVDANSVYFQENVPHPVAQFMASEMLLENIIGMGEFGTVVEVTGIRLDSSTSDDGDTSSPPLVNIQQNVDGLSDSIRCKVQSCFELSSLDNFEVPPLEEESDSGYDKENIRQRDELRSQIVDTVSTEATTTPIHYNYAVKQIRRDLYPDKREEAAKSLAKEQKFLQTIQHPNIVRLRGIVDNPGGTNHMLVLDKLSHSLLQQIVDWKEELPSNSFAFPWKSPKVQETEARVLSERLFALYDIAQAISFLHSKSIVFRDLKVENAAKRPGNGALQLFDFGLARELKAVDQVNQGEYHLTGLTGTFRIMSPEVIQCTPYGLSTDIFSFGIFAWEVFSGNLNKLTAQEVCRGQRPECRGVDFPASFESSLLNRCWNESPNKRATIDQVCKIIASELLSGRKDDGKSEIINRVKLLRQTSTS